MASAARLKIPLAFKTVPRVQWGVMKRDSLQHEAAGFSETTYPLG
jgi:hypothetical protein